MALKKASINIQTKFQRNLESVPFPEVRILKMCWMVPETQND